MKTALLLTLLASPLYAGSVTLAWDANPEPDVQTYIVYYGHASRNYPYSTNVGNVTRATVFGIDTSQEWFFALTAQNTAGLASDFSEEVKSWPPIQVAVTLRGLSYTPVLPPGRWSLDSLLGDRLMGGINPASSDNVLVFDPAIQQFDGFWYCVEPGYAGWKTFNYAPAGTNLFESGRGLIVLRRATDDLTLNMSGYSLGRVTLYPGGNLTGDNTRVDPYALPVEPFVGAPNPAGADSFTYLLSDGGLLPHFLCSVPGFEGWYCYDYQPVCRLIQPGEAVLITIRGALRTWTY